nr:hypothetical protein [Thiobacillus sp. 65-1402]
MDNRDDTNMFGKDPVDQRIGEFLQGEHARFMSAIHPKIGKSGKQRQGLLELVCETIRCGECEFFDIPVNRRIEVALRLVGKANPHWQLWPWRR